MQDIGEWNNGNMNYPTNIKFKAERTPLSVKPKIDLKNSNYFNHLHTHTHSTELIGDTIIFSKVQ